MLVHGSDSCISYIYSCFRPLIHLEVLFKHFEVCWKLLVRGGIMQISCLHMLFHSSGSFGHHDLGFYSRFRQSYSLGFKMKTLVHVSIMCTSYLYCRFSMQPFLSAKFLPKPLMGVKWTT
ncbi:hypothetical protein KP509_38G035500 [Ceratopteris richardii]|uniref:Uncharacterized protein n=1 Tax=Ceratopteris richardii TaxID=49495 RepID=A0A8T2Q2Y2_CERRI|nr:hypothetical protein KP509_38G035500 [Ceratopteris richardii]